MKTDEPGTIDRGQIPLDVVQEGKQLPQSTVPLVTIHQVPNQRLFKVSAAARYLGICDDTIRKYADLGQIPVYRFLNGDRVFRLEDLNGLIDSLPLWDDARDASPRRSSEGRH